MKKNKKKSVSTKKEYKHSKSRKKTKTDIKKGKEAIKISRVMEEFKKGVLHGGSKKGPKVYSRKQAIAIALSEASKSKKLKRLSRSTKRK